MSKVVNEVYFGLNFLYIILVGKLIEILKLDIDLRIFIEMIFDLYYLWL